MQIDATEIAEFWRWLGNAAVAVSGYFLLQVVNVQRRHGNRLNNHAQRLTKLDNDIETSGE